MMKIFLFIFLFYGVIIYSQDSPPKYEFRALWIATVFNTDWPSSNKLSPKQQKEEFKKIINTAKATGFNAVIVQIRSMGEAFYPSQYYPWSSFLTGKDNCPPHPYYDPLAWMIEETHRLGLEFHAWFNPFRLATTSQLPKLSNKHPAKKFPQSTITYDDKIYLDPGNPSHREFAIKGIIEVVKKYDIDAVHIDDYFYPYPIKNKQFNDKNSFELYNRKSLSLANWRRQNINSFVWALSHQIKQQKSWVKFGISPFGIWRNRAQDPRGSNTNSLIPSYDGLFADSLLWAKQGWIDYIIPQIYWHFYQKNSAYEEVLTFWRKEIVNCPKTHLYVGHALYKINGNDGVAWKKPQEIPRQIIYNRRCPEVKGSAFYNASCLMKNPLRVRDYLDRIYYKYPALIPQMPWLGNNYVKAVQLIEVLRMQGNSSKVIFTDLDIKSNATYYIIYRFRLNEPKITTADHIVGILGRAPNGRKTYVFIDTQALVGFSYIYYVTAVNRFHQESSYSNGYLLPEK